MHQANKFSSKALDVNLRNCSICKTSFLEFGVTTCIDHMSVSIKSTKIGKAKKISFKLIGKSPLRRQPNPLPLSKQKKKNNAKPKPLSCEMCMKTFTDEISFKEHIDMHFDEFCPTPKEE